MKKFFASILAVSLSLALLAGCGSQKDSLSGTVNTNGSTSMEKVIGALTEAFEEENGSVTINYNGSGSGAGVQSILDGSADLGLSSRELKAEEESQGAVANIVALDGVAIVVNPVNSVGDLTVEQIAQLATGEISSWAELGGEDVPVAFYGREAGSGTRTAFEEIVGVTDICKYTNEYSSTGDIIGNTASNPNAIGYASLSNVNESVKAVKVAGVDCTEATVQDGSYAIQRPFLLVTKGDAQLSPAAQAFLDFALSENANQLIRIAGAVPPAK